MRFGRYSVTCAPPPTGPRNAEPPPEKPNGEKKALEAADALAKEAEHLLACSDSDAEAAMKQRLEEALFTYKRVRGGNRG